MPRLIGPDEIAQAIAALRLDVPVFYGLQADDGQITLYLYGGPVVVWIPTGLRPATSMSTDMDAAAPTTRHAAGPTRPAASGARKQAARVRAGLAPAPVPIPAPEKDKP